MDAIVTEDLRKRYKDVQALDGVSFAVREGEVFGLLGPNGAGKSTTVRTLATLTQPDAGRALGPGARAPRAAHPRGTATRPTTQHPPPPAAKRRPWPEVANQGRGGRRLGWRT